MDLPIVYIVQPGDTLYTLAKRFDTTVQRIAQNNGISDVDRIFTGQKLVVSGDVSPQWKTYRVQRGDTLYGIAERLGTTVSALLQYNRLRDPDVIYPGQILRYR